MNRLPSCPSVSTPLLRGVPTERRRGRTQRTIFKIMVLQVLELKRLAFHELTSGHDRLPSERLVPGLVVGRHVQRRPFIVLLRQGQGD